MANYHYTGRDHNGTQVEGDYRGNTIDQVIAYLRHEKITPITIKEQHSIQVKKGQTTKITTTELILLCQQLHTLLKSGIPILQAIQGLSSNMPNPRLAYLLGEIFKHIEAGTSLSQSLALYSDVFPPVFTNAISVGEQTGRLYEAFHHLAQYLSQEQELKRRLKKALRYPIMVIAFLIIAITILNMVVIPAFIEFFDNLKIALPWYTQMLIASSNFMTQYWLILSIIFFALILSAYSLTRSGKGEYQWHYWKLRLPIIGIIIEKLLLARFCRSFAISQQTGIPIISALHIIPPSLGNRYLEKKITRLREYIERGESIARSAQNLDLFPPLMLQMIQVGEDSGNLDTILLELSSYYEQEIDYQLKSLSSIIEPLLIIIISSMVLFVALSIFTPMWDFASHARA